MNILIQSANAVLPLFILMMIGFFVRKTSLVSEEVLVKVNRLNFYVGLPAICFHSISGGDFTTVTDLKLVLTVALGILGFFAISGLIVPRFVSDPKRRGSIILAVSRSNDVLFGLAVARALVPAEQMAPVMLAISIAALLTNTFSVIAMELNRGNKVRISVLVKKVLLNPIVIACTAGLLFSFAGIKLPVFLSSPIESLAGMATPLAFIIIGSRIHKDAFLHDRKTIATVSAVKLLLVPAIMLAVGFLVGLNKVEMLAVLCIFASPCATASYTLACEMGGDERLSSELIAVTSVISILTMFICTYVLTLLGGI